MLRSDGLTREILERAYARAEQELREVGGVQALMWRLKRDGSVPVEERERALDSVLGRQEVDGSWDRGLGATARALLTLSEIELRSVGTVPPDAAQRAVAWIRRRRRKPRRFAESCAPVWHERGLCAHFAAGFFALADGDADESLELWSGAGVTGQDNVRLAASALALRAGMHWNLTGTDVMLHLEALRRIVGFWCGNRGRQDLISAAASLTALHAVIDAPPSAENVATSADGLALLVGSQRADGTWADLDPVHVLDVLLTAQERGYGVRELDLALRRAGMLVAAWLHESIDSRELANRNLLLLWRTLQYCTGPVEPAAQDAT
jgi:hypothetical protein